MLEFRRKFCKIPGTLIQKVLEKVKKNSWKVLEFKSIFFVGTMKWIIFFFLFKLRQCFVATEKLEYWCQLEWFFFSLVKPSMILLYYLENQAIRNYWQETNPTIGSGVKRTAEKLQCKLIYEYCFFIWFECCDRRVQIKVMAEKNKSRLGVYLQKRDPFTLSEK